MPKAGRPKETKRKHLHMMVLPQTDKALRGAVDKGTKVANTVGKIVDALVVMKGKK